jgi:hypothetical protein
MHTRSDPSTADRPLAWERPALAGGIVFAVGQIAATAYFITVLAPHLPPLDAPLAQQGAFYSDYHAENALVAYLYLLSVPFFLVFLGGLFGALRRLEQGVGVLTATAIGAGLALAMVWPIGIVVADSGQGMARQGLEPLAVMAFDGIAQLTLALSAFPRAVLLLAASLGLLSSAVPRWVGWSGMGLALVGLVGTATLLDANLYPVLALGTLLFDVWVGLVGGILLRRVAAESPRRVARQASLVAG